MILENLLSEYRRLRLRLSWERRWRSDAFQPRWLADAPRSFVVTGYDAGWLSAGRSVLDIGCGLGHTAAWLASHGLDVVGIDFSRHAIAKATEVFRHQPRLSFKRIDVCGPDHLNMTFDVLIDGGCLHVIPKSLHVRYVQNLLLWSRPASRFVVTMKTVTTGPREWLEYVQSLLYPAFEVVQYEEVPSTVADRTNPVVHLIRRPGAASAMAPVR
jgi:cyclopropane fatty-acyl-phospholipid synthase-like methyltransferase